jgi:MFS family permease
MDDLNMEKVKEMKKYSWIVIALLFLLFVGSGIVVNPFYGDVNVIDEGQFGGWITHMLHGQKLYKDTYAAYGPLYIYPSYMLAKIFGSSVFLIRIVYLVLGTLGALIAAKVAMQRLEIKNYIQYLILALLLIIPGFGMRQGTGLGALLVLDKAIVTNKKKWWLVSGMAVVVTLLVSSDMGIFIGVISAIVIFIQFVKSVTLKKTFQNLLYFFGGVVLVVFPFLLFASIDGWVTFYFQTIIDDYTSYSGMGLPNGQAFPNLLALLEHAKNPIEILKVFVSKEAVLYWNYFLYFCLFAYLTILFLIKGKIENTFIILITVFGFFLSLILLGRFGHIPFVIPISFIIIGYVASRLTSLPTSKIRNLILIVIIIFSLRFISFYRPHFIKLFDIPTKIFNTSTNSKFVGPIAISGAQNRQFLFIQNFINKNVKHAQTIFFLGNEPVMYLVADRVSPSRFNLPEVINSRAKRYELINDLERSKTKYIIYNTSSWDVDGVSNMERLPEVMHYISENYTKTINSGFVIYKRN